jgi:TusA-related sulfurtransferase
MNQPATNFYQLDLRGEPCPYPVVFSLETLHKLPKGSILEIMADCPQSFISVPEEIVKAGYLLVAPPEKTGPSLRFLVQVPG